MRSLLVKVINISKQNSKALENLLSPETLKELNQGENEIVILSRSFSAVTQAIGRKCPQPRAGQKNTACRYVQGRPWHLQHGKYRHLP